jgi:hypothetical protein
MKTRLAIVCIFAVASGQANAKPACSSDEAKATVVNIADRVIAKPMLASVANTAVLLKQRASELEAEIAAARAHNLPGYGRMPDCAEPHGSTCFDYAGRIAADSQQLARISNVKPLPGNFTFTLDRVITTDETPRKTSCKALLVETSDQRNDGSREITYTLEMTDDGKLYATVWGLENPPDTEQN